MSAYRRAPDRPLRKGRAVDPWLLALLFAWVCDAWRVAEGVASHRKVGGELAFAALLAIVSLVVLARRLVKRRRRA